MVKFFVFLFADTFLFFMRANLISQQTLVGGKMSRIVLQLWFELFYGDCRKKLYLKRAWDFVCS
jgi:hypothetical protein